MKIELFLISFSLYFTVNALFFTDKTMHKIYKDKGIYNFIYQIPKIIYSTLISSFVNLIIKILSLSESNIIHLKTYYKTKGYQKVKNEVIKCLKLKFNIFLILGFFILCIMWYYCSVFCAVYKNTQKILLKDTLSSFVISLIYPFIINFIPGVLRIPSLKYKYKALYQISKIIAIV